MRPGGTAVIMQPHTGEILALANWPTFNPNAFREASEIARKNRAIQDTYEPGSTFKLVTASAAFEENVLDPADLIDCAAGLHHVPRAQADPRRSSAYGTLTFQDVIVKSSNVGAIKAGLRIGPERLEIHQPIWLWTDALAGLPRRELRDRVESGEARRQRARVGVDGLPDQRHPAADAGRSQPVANGGTLIEPRTVRAFIRNGRREPMPTKPMRRTISAGTAATMTQIMEPLSPKGRQRRRRSKDSRSPERREPPPSS